MTPGTVKLWESSGRAGGLLRLIIDRCLVRGIIAAKLEDEMGEYLRQTKLVFDWRSGGDMQGYGGQSGAQNAANKMKVALSDEDINIGQIAAAVKNMA